MDIEDIAQLAELMSSHDLSEVFLQTGDMTLKMTRGGSATQAMTAATPPNAAPGVPSAVLPAPEEADAEQQDESPTDTIASPIVGTIYMSPSPDSPPFVSAGDHVTEDTVVCIIEAMKVMNEIKAELGGIIKRVLVESGTAVEYGQPLFEVELD